MSKLEIFRKQQALRASVGNRPLIHSAASPEAVAQILSVEPDYERLSSFSYFEAISLTAADHSDEALRLIDQLEQGFDAARLDDMLQKCQRDVIGAIAGPLGLGKVLAVHDKIGGNVTTIHNAGQDIYARKEDGYNRAEYTDAPNSEGKRFSGDGKKSVGSEFTKSKLIDKTDVIDGYTLDRIKGSESSPDHIISTSAFHKDGGFMLPTKQKADFGTDKDNLISTRRDINISMSDDDKREWVDRKSNGRKITNEDHYKIKKPQLEAAVQRGEKAAEKHGPSFSEKAEFYTKNAAATGVNEGLKMGTQQAFGLLMVEIFSSALEEIKDVYKNGQQSESVLDELSIRLKRLGTRIASKWKDMIEGFSGGFISGFISNALTMLINMFVTTGKRAVRMIREGVFSLLKAMKMMVFPPENLTFAQVAHEALKLLAVGGVVIGGVALEEMVEKLIMSVPLLVPIAPMLTAILVGAITALCMTFVCYLIDKMDLLGVIKSERNKTILSGLNTEFDEKVTRSYAIIEDIEKYLLKA